MRFRNPFANFKKTDYLLWIGSMLVITVSFFTFGNDRYLTLSGSLLGVTALIFIARGDVIGQILTLAFSVFYAFISWKFRYYGEMITYLGMTFPIAALSVFTWLKHSSEESHEVRVHHLSHFQWVLLALFTAVVTGGFGWVLALLNTPNLAFSILSVATSFIAAYLLLFRNPYYAIAYAANDLVLIILWILAAKEDPSYFPMILCFMIFLMNDIYGFISWMRMEKRQRI